MNPFDLFKNMQNMQSQMKDMQDKMKEIRVQGSAGGDMVTVEMNGELTLLSVRISPDIVDPADVGMLEDLVQAAMIDAGRKVKEKIQEEMSSLTGGLPLPPNMFGMG